MEEEIIFNIDVMLAKRKMSVTELAEKVGITIANISVLKNGRAKAIKVSTLAKLCEALDCQPGDILEYKKKETKIMKYTTKETKTNLVALGNCSCLSLSGNRNIHMEESATIA